MQHTKYPKHLVTPYPHDRIINQQNSFTTLQVLSTAGTLPFRYFFILSSCLLLFCTYKPKSSPLCTSFFPICSFPHPFHELQTHDKAETFPCKVYESIILGVIVGKLLKIPIPYNHQGVKLTFASLTYESDEEMKGGWSMQRRERDMSPRLKWPLHISKKDAVVARCIHGKTTFFVLLDRKSPDYSRSIACRICLGSRL